MDATVGRVRVRVAVDGEGEREVTDEGQPVQTARGAFALAAISPGPWTDWPEGARPAYRFGFRRA